MSDPQAVWYLPGEADKPSGPFTAEQVVSRWQEGQIAETTVCWREGMSDWRPLAEVEPFATAIRGARERPGMIRFRCTCGNQIAVASEFAGGRGRCEACGRTVAIPGGSQRKAATAATPQAHVERRRRFPLWLTVSFGLATVLVIAAVLFRTPGSAGKQEVSESGSQLPLVSRQPGEETTGNGLARPEDRQLEPSHSNVVKNDTESASEPPRALTDLPGIQTQAPLEPALARFLRAVSAPPVAMFRANPQRTGFYKTSGVPGFGILRWKFRAGNYVRTSPAVLANVVYVSCGHRLHAIDVGTGKRKWTAKIPVLASSPAVANGRVYCGASDNHLYAVDTETGQVIWKFKTGGRVSSSPALLNGVVYFGSNDGHVYAVDMYTAEPKWTLKTGGEVRSSPAIADGVVYFGSNDGHIYAVDLVTGVQNWKCDLGGGESSPAIADGVVYYYGDRLCALDAKTGQRIWSSTISGGCGSSPAVADGVVYVGSDDRNLYAVDAVSGREIWRFEAKGWACTSPAVADGLVYFGSGDHRLYAVDVRTGDERWRYVTGGEVRAPPTVADGVLYFGDGDGVLYALHALDRPAMAVPSSFIGKGETKKLKKADDMLRDALWARHHKLNYSALRLARRALEMKTHLLPGTDPQLASIREFIQRIESPPHGRIRRATPGDATMFRANIERTGVFPGRALQTVKGPAWIFPGVGERCSPVVSAGVVCVGARNLWALDVNTGLPLWTFEARSINGVWSTPAIADGTVYFAGSAPGSSKGGHLHALELQTGREKWRFATTREVDSSPAVCGGTVYFGCNDRHLYAVAADTGEARWKFTTEGTIGSSPAVAGGVVYFGSADAHLYAVDADSGAQIWRFKCESSVFASPAVDRDAIFVGDQAGYLHAIEARTGQENWKFGPMGQIYSSAAISDDLVYVGSMNGNLYAVDRQTGRERWRFTAQDAIASSPCVAGGIVYFGSHDGYLYAVDGSSGKLKWDFGFEGHVLSSPAVADGRVYYIAGGSLFALH